jgi:peptide/nickel transport system permease protein
MTADVNTKRSFWKESGLYTTFRRLLKGKLAMVGLVIVLLIAVSAIFAGQISPYDPIKIDYMNFSLFGAPTSAHIMGTDHLGRDTFSRVIHGARISLSVGFVAVSISLALGTTLGLIAGYKGGALETIIMGAMDTIWAFPTLILALAITTLLGPSLINIMLAIGIVYTPSFARLVRSMTLTVRNLEYVESAKVLGLSNGKIILRHIFPNITATLIVQASLNAAQAILAEASLSFLGLGIQPPNASWGSMLKESMQYLDITPWMSIFPGAAIFLLVLGLNFLGDGLRDALDIKIRID